MSNDSNLLPVLLSLRRYWSSEHHESPCRALQLPWDFNYHRLPLNYLSRGEGSKQVLNVVIWSNVAIVMGYVTSDTRAAKYFDGAPDPLELVAFQFFQKRDLVPRRPHRKWRRS